MLASIGLRHHHSAVLRPISDLSDPPAKLTLHPIQGSCHSTVEMLRQGSSKDFQVLMAAWIEAQSADHKTEVVLLKVLGFMNELAFLIRQGLENA